MFLAENFERARVSCAPGFWDTFWRKKY